MTITVLDQKAVCGGHRIINISLCVFCKMVYTRKVLVDNKIKSLSVCTIYILDLCADVFSNGTNRSRTQN